MTFAKNNLVTVSKIQISKNILCPPVSKEKSKRASHPPKPVPNSKQRLHLLHMDLCGPMRIASINGKRYVLVIVDDYSRYTWQTQQHVQHQPATIADNVPNAMFDENTFVNPFATLSTRDVESSSSQYVDPSNMHTFYQPYPHEFQWTKDHPLEQVIRRTLSTPVLTRNQVRSDGDMCSTLNELSSSSKADDWDVIPPLDNIKPLTLKRVYRQEEGNRFLKNPSHPVLDGSIRIFLAYAAHKSFTVFQMDVKIAFLHVKEGTIQAKPTEKHLKEVKRIFRYLHGEHVIRVFGYKDSVIELTGFQMLTMRDCKHLEEYFPVEAQFLAKSWLRLVLKETRLYDAVNRGSRICVSTFCCGPSPLDATLLTDYASLSTKFLSSVFKISLAISCQPGPTLKNKIHR
ncbi:retrovirus-related pol polyprotein from transposon TNT 1-94 [Tanacetum coccineum]